MSTQTELLREAVALIVRDLCETEPANPDDPDSVCVSVDELRETVSRHISEPFLAKIDASKGEESEFQVISGADEDACIEAATSGPRDVALREAMRYAHQYAEDGPVKVVELVTVAMLAAAARQDGAR